ncbi:exodeoxyribonuclease VII small subunit [Solimonas soli]|uniref:exodeoxyribonuclease VII small subunit n=1 Tax=Solimonas soli TaxID=413479 RepID=UPI0004800CA0|nr:exodeoxyribonuclease VII small subunit [Solimonas soli]
MPTKTTAPPPASPSAADPVGQFEDAMKELEGIVQSLERGDLRLDESLRLFERGVVLARQCRGSLENAELKVHELLADGDRQADGDEPS